MSKSHPDRRQFLTVIGSLAVAGVTIPVVAGCGSGDGQGAQLFPEPDDSTKAEIAAAIKAGEPAVGAATFFEDARLVITQPTKGSYVALSTVCPHQGGKVDRLSNGKLICPLHGSTFDPETGEALSGPTQIPLPNKQVVPSGGTVTLT